METMKTWRSKLKKTGASALAAFMLCGSFSAFAQGSGEEITTHPENGDAQLVTPLTSRGATWYSFTTAVNTTQMTVHL